jgi:hypothetical protein
MSDQLLTLRSLLAWNLRRLVRSPRYGVAMVALSFVTLLMSGVVRFMPGALGALLVCAMAVGFASPAVRSVTAEARYLLARPVSRVACLISWTLFALALTSVTVVTVAVLAFPANAIQQVTIASETAARLLHDGGFASTELEIDSVTHAKVPQFALPGFERFEMALLALGVLWGLFARLADVAASRDNDGVRRPARLSLRYGPLVGLLVAWVVLGVRGQATLVAVWSYLHPTAALGAVACGVVTYAVVCWRAWTRGDVR